MSNKAQSLQGPFLNAIRTEHIPVSLYLLNGIKLQGQIESFDQYSVVLRNAVTQMVYKHAITTVVPGRRPVIDPSSVSTEDPGESVQEAFLSALKKTGNRVFVYLVNGIKLEGTVLFYDQFSFLLELEEAIQLVYKHGVSTIVAPR